MNDTNKSQQSDKQTQDNNDLKITDSTEIHNPFDKGEDKKITQEDLENEQLFKEAQTERD